MRRTRAGKATVRGVEEAYTRFDLSNRAKIVDKDE